MLQIRKSSDRGHVNHGWLDTYHTFSFASYYDPDFMGFRALRVINDDRVAAGEGFGTHPHRDMEIVTLVLEGELEHKDSLGTGSIIRPGEVQRMSAGTGVTHSEYNPSKKNPLHLLQIWIIPEKNGLVPSYEQKSFASEELSGKLRLAASRDGRNGSVKVHQDMNLYLSDLTEAQTIEYQNAEVRYLWLHIATGKIQINNLQLQAGDALAVAGKEALQIKGLAGLSKILLFDLN